VTPIISTAAWLLEVSIKTTDRRYNQNRKIIVVTETLPKAVELAEKVIVLDTQESIAVISGHKVAKDGHYVIVDPDLYMPKPSAPVTRARTKTVKP
jgi:energy-coupling factor transporter ATP-binding protein EcfA2